MSSVVVLGAGVNGLVAASLLARAGHTVTVVDSAPRVGGAARQDEITSGYLAPGILDRTERFSPTVVNALGLGSLQRGKGATVWSCDRDGKGLLCPDGLGAEATGLGAADQAAWAAFQSVHQRLALVLRPLMESTPPSPLDRKSLSWGWAWSMGRAYQKLTPAERELLLRVPPAPLWDWLVEKFEAPELRASMAWAGLEGAFAGPASPGTAATRMFHDSSDFGPIVGGAGRLLDVLEADCRSKGVTIRTGVSPSVLVSRGAVSGVEVDGERVKASGVVSTLDPVRTLLELTRDAELSPAFERALRNVRRRGTTVRFDFALDRAFELATQPGQRVSRIRVAGALVDVERAFDACKYHELPAAPWLEIRVPSADPAQSGFAPEGRDVVSVLVRFVTPEALQPDGSVELLKQRVLETLDRLAPGVSGTILAERFQDHSALEREYGLTQGNLSHGEPGLDQLLSLRPIADCGRYTTPVSGLVLGGMGSHPGGGLTGLPGWLGAQTLDQELKRIG